MVSIFENVRDNEIARRAADIVAANFFSGLLPIRNKIIDQIGFYHRPDVGTAESSR